MFKKNAKHGADGGEGGTHGDRPWVYFMIDSFFLVTQFFVLTFQVRTAGDIILPHKLPARGAPNITSPLPELSTDVDIRVHRASVDATPWYTLNGGKEMALTDIKTMLGALTSGHDPLRFSVRISYAGSVKFDDVMPIFNTCTGLKIKKCGLLAPRSIS